MLTDTEGVILKQIKTVGGRRMIVLFSKKYGKISAGTSIAESGKNKTALALRPFTYGRYELYKNRDSYNINGAEVLKSWFSIGEDVDKYMSASYVLELTDRILPEEQSSVPMFNLLTDFFSMLEERKKAFGTIVVGFQMKALSIMGNGPVLGSCALCGSKDELGWFSVADGGLICKACLPKEWEHNSLIFPVGADIIHILNYMETHSLNSLRGLALKEENEQTLKRVLKSYISYHLGIDGLKSEGLSLGLGH